MNSVSIEQYTHRLVSDIADTITREVFTAAEEALREAIAETVYTRRNKMYQNTGQFINAVQVSDIRMGNGVAEFEIIINTGRLSVVPNRPDWPAYGSITSNGWDDKDGIVETLDQGSDGSPHFNHQGYGFFEKAEGKLDSSLIKIMAQGLVSRGYKIRMM